MWLTTYELPEIVAVTLSTLLFWGAMANLAAILWIMRRPHRG